MDGIQITKEKTSVGISSFRLISLSNVEGKIFFVVIACHIAKFPMDHGFINTSVQKASNSGFPGLLKHLTIESPKQALDVAWMIARSTGSGNHHTVPNATKPALITLRSC